MLPGEEAFPYTVRVVSDILESNGSSSMASVCGGTLAMMDAGVPLAAPVAGVAMGLIVDEATGRHAVLSDIAGAEDHYGDMDFKVAGTASGITALQMDIKIGGITPAIMREALEQARAGRLHILERMRATLPDPRSNISTFAPRIVTVKIPVDKIRDVIGPGGKTIRSIIERTGVRIDVEDDGTVNVASNDDESAQRALSIIEELTATPELNKSYLGTVQRITDFGAFVEVLPGVDGLLHVSETRALPRQGRAGRAQGRRAGAREGDQRRPVGQDPAEPEGAARQAGRRTGGRQPAGAPAELAPTPTTAPRPASRPPAPPSSPRRDDRRSPSSCGCG